MSHVPHPIGWEDRVIATMEKIVMILKVIDRVKAGDSSEDKLAGAVQMLQAQEPQTVETDELAKARMEMVSALVSYANTLTSAQVTHGA